MPDNIEATQWSTCKELSEDKRLPTPTALLDKDEFCRDGRMAVIREMRDE